MENLIEVNIPEADMSEINQAITTLNEKLLPHLVNLSPGDRLELPKMGDKTVAFVTKSISHMEENPNLIPKYLEVDPVKVDLAAIEMLRKILSALKNLADMADDTMLLSGSEAYVAALAFYNYIKGAARANVPGAEMIYNDLKKRFPGGSRSK